MDDPEAISPPGGFRQLLDAAPDVMLVVDRDGLVRAVNLEAERFFGWAETELVGESIGRLIPLRFQWLLDRHHPSHPESPPIATGSGTIACFARRRDGTESPVELTRGPLGPPHEGESLLTLRDLTKWRRAQESRFHGDEQARATLESIGDAVITTDATSRITYLNPVAERMTGWPAGEAIGQALDAILPLISETTRLPVANTARRCLEEGRSVDLEDGVLLLRRDGAEIPIGDSAAPVRDSSGVTTGVVLVIQDESEKRRVGHRLSFEATHDALTGLVNRREFERRLSRLIADLVSNPGEHVLLCLDLDRFKLVNDTCGHDAGDDLLRKLSPFLATQLRRRDTLARIGGDEFGVLLENCPTQEASRIAETFRLAIAEYRFQWGGKVFSIGASIGAVSVTNESGSIATVMRAGDAACYTAKEEGGNRVHFDRAGRSAADVSQAIARRVTALARAADEGHFQLHAQPIVSLRPDFPAHPRFEILLRLPNATHGTRSAADFLPQAERYNLMPVIDRWVVRETMALLGTWHREFPTAVLPVCSINLSASALVGPDLLTLIEQQLVKQGIPAQALCFEVAESAVLANLGQAVRFLSGLRALGCAAALEDFGSGVTSFTYLKSLPVDFLKIGHPFVGEIVADPLYQSIVSAVRQIGRSLGIFTIAKQVDDPAVLRRLRTLEIEYAQGWELAPPTALIDEGGRISMPAFAGIAGTD